MVASTALSVVLAGLAEALADPDVDLASGLQVLSDVARAAVPSTVGVSLVVDTAAGPLTLTHLAGGSSHAPILASLAVPLAAGAVLVLLAARQGAFGSGATGGPAHLAVEIDQHLDVPDAEESLARWHAASTVDRAIGVLIDRGDDPDRARTRLAGTAAAEGISLVQSALRVLADPP